MASMYDIPGFLLTGMPSTVSTSMWNGQYAAVNQIDFNFLDNYLGPSGSSNNSLNINTTDQIAIGDPSVAYTVNQILVVSLTIHTTTGDYDLAAVAGTNATGFRAYHLSNGTYVLRPLDNFLAQITDPANPIPVPSQWTGFTFHNISTTTGTTMTAQNDAFPTCLVSGTRIRTARGQTRVEDLRIGDLVATVDHGLQPVRWITQSSHSASDLDLYPQHRPMRIAPGAMGPDVPSRALFVSPQHRILAGNAVAETQLGTAEVLAAARTMTARRGIGTVAAARDVAYFNLLFDRHELIEAEGMIVESLFPGPVALDRDPAISAVLRSLHRTPDDYQPARPFANRKQMERMILELGSRALVEPDRSAVDTEAPRKVA